MPKTKEQKYEQTSRIWDGFLKRAQEKNSPLPHVDATADTANSLAVHAGGDMKAISWLARWANRHDK